MALEHAKPGEVVHLNKHDVNLGPEKTSAIVKADRFEAVRLALAAGSTIPEHKVSGFITLLCLQGHVIVEAGKPIEMKEGDWVYLDRAAPHSVRGIEQSTLLLTILFD